MRRKHVAVLFVLSAVVFVGLELLHLGSISHDHLHDIDHHLRLPTSSDVRLHRPPQRQIAETHTSKRDAHVLHFAEEVAATHGTQRCEVPVLHPQKFKDKMGWGIRKNFTPCSPFNNPFSSASEAGMSWSVRVDLAHPACASSSPALLVFREMEAKEFTRLTSTLDAEFRQNDLQERYRLRLPLDADGPLPAFAEGRRPLDVNGSSGAISEPYAVVVCGAHAEVHVRVPRIVKPPHAALSFPKRRIRNFLHIMFDSTSLHSLLRSARRTVSWLERMNNDLEAPSAVFPLFHYHAVSCCSPGNQIPVYSGNMNGEGDRFVKAEPFRSSRDWLWNVASSLGYTTFWSLDNCPDKSARDYHAFPSVDCSVVAPLCLAGTILSHKDQSCVGRRTVDETVLGGLRSFMKTHSDLPKFAAVQFITPHEESEKLILELDVLFEAFLVELETSGALEDTALLFWSDHGINFGKYASTHDGEIEKMFPFANFVLPKSFARETGFGDHLWANRRELVTPYDVYEATRSILYYPSRPPPFAHDPSNPPLPLPRESHIMASFQKNITPLNIATARVAEMTRDCLDANIPVEFCTCIPFVQVSSTSSEYEQFVNVLVPFAVSEHASVVDGLNVKQQLCKPAAMKSVVSVALQEWPTTYHPKEQEQEKQVWMAPNRDAVRVRYELLGGELFEALFSVSKSNRSAFDLSLLVRIDAMTKKCGVTDKRDELLCVCN